MYEPYVDEYYYKDVYQGDTIPDEQLSKALRQTSRHIDSLTYNRIVGRGFFNLTEFQQDAIKEVCCLQADFEHENKELIENVLSSYSINGVSMSFETGWNVHADKGIAIKKDVYSLLEQTGLCCRLLR